VRNHSHVNVFSLQENFHAKETHFHMKRLVRRLVLKQRQKVTRKWAIVLNGIAHLNWCRNIWIFILFSSREAWWPNGQRTGLRIQPSFETPSCSLTRINKNAPKKWHLSLSENREGHLNESTNQLFVRKQVCITIMNVVTMNHVEVYSAGMNWTLSQTGL